MIQRKNETVSNYVRLIENMGSIVSSHEKALNVFLI